MEVLIPHSKKKEKLRKISHIVYRLPYIYEEFLNIERSNFVRITIVGGPNQNMQK